MPEFNRSDYHVVLVTGSRKWGDSRTIESDLEDEACVALYADKRLVVVHGNCATGADFIAEEWCDMNEENSILVPARWGRAAGRRAGPIRNSIIGALFEFDAVLSYPLPDSKGTHDMTRKSRLCVEPK